MSTINNCFTIATLYTKIHIFAQNVTFFVTFLCYLILLKIKDNDEFAKYR